MTYVKYLTEWDTGGYSAYRWPLPTRNEDGSWTPGEWTPFIESIEPCRTGYHSTDTQHLLNYFSKRLYILEYQGQVRPIGNLADPSSTKHVGQQARLVREVEGWRDPEVARLLMIDMLTHLLQDSGSNLAMRKAAEVIRQHLSDGPITTYSADHWNRTLVDLRELSYRYSMRGRSYMLLTACLRIAGVVHDHHRYDPRPLTYCLLPLLVDIFRDNRIRSYASNEVQAYRKANDLLKRQLGLDSE